MHHKRIIHIERAQEWGIDMENVGYYNGEFDYIENMKIPMNDRVVYFGDGVYEATFVKNHNIFALPEHLDRLYRSLNILEIPYEVTREDLTNELQKMVNLMDSEETHLLYWQITRGTGHRDHVFPEDSKPNLLITVRPIPMKDIYSKTYKLISIEDIRFMMCHVKSLNLIPSVIANQRAKEAGCDEAVFHRGNRVTECAHSNISILKDGVFQTAPTDNFILPGITRKHLIEIAREKNIPVLEQPFTMEELFQADEVIVTSSSALCVRALELDGKAIGGKDLQTLRILQDAYLEKFNKEIAK